MDSPAVALFIGCCHSTRKEASQGSIRSICNLEYKAKERRKGNVVGEGVDAIYYPVLSRDKVAAKLPSGVHWQGSSRGHVPGRHMVASP